MSSSEVIRKHDVAALSPTKKRRPELSPVAPVALAPETILGEPWVPLRWVRLGNNGIPRNQQREEGAVKRRGRATAPQGRSEHVPPADDCGLADLVAAQRPEKAARLLLAIAAPLAAAEQGLDRRDAVTTRQIIFSPTLLRAIRRGG